MAVTPGPSASGGGELPRRGVVSLINALPPLAPVCFDEADDELIVRAAGRRRTFDPRTSSGSAGGIAGGYGLGYLIGYGYRSKQLGVHAGPRVALTVDRFAGFGLRNASVPLFAEIDLRLFPRYPVIVQVYGLSALADRGRRGIEVRSVVSGAMGLYLGVERANPKVRVRAGDAELGRLPHRVVHGGVAWIY